MSDFRTLLQNLIEWDGGEGSKGYHALKYYDARQAALVALSGWLVHEGGAMPVQSGTVVDFKRRCDTEPMAVWRPEEYLAEDLRWEHRGKSSDIILYRIVREPPPVEREVVHEKP